MQNLWRSVFILLRHTLVYVWKTLKNKQKTEWWWGFRDNLISKSWSISKTELMVT